MILLDTNLLSGLMRPMPAAAIENWISVQPVASIFISAITEAELRYGLALLPEGQRKKRLSSQTEAMLAEDFADRRFCRLRNRCHRSLDFQAVK